MWRPASHWPSRRPWRTQGDDLVQVPLSLVHTPIWRSRPTLRALMRTVDPRFAQASVPLREIAQPKDRARYEPTGAGRGGAMLGCPCS